MNLNELRNLDPERLAERPDEKDLDCHGPYPSKFAEWIRAQITESWKKL
jgi:hypothetical protein